MIPETNGIAKLAMAAAAVVVVVAGITLLPRGSNLGGGVALPSPSPSASPSPSPSPVVEDWPLTSLTIGRHNATMSGVRFSFDVPTSAWTSLRLPGMIEKGSFDTADYRWIGFLWDFDAVATDPCAGLAAPVGPSVIDLADSMTTIPGTDAVGPTDATVGGFPAKVVRLTIHDDIACSSHSFFLYGKDSAYPTTVDSEITDWIFEVDGTRHVIHSDQAGSSTEIGQEIQQIVDSIQFE